MAIGTPNPGGGAAPTITTVTTTPYTVTAGDDEVLIDLDTPGAVAITLGAIADHDTKKVTIKDTKGDAGTNNITITPDGVETIDGAATLVLSVNYAAATLVGAGSEWSIT